MSQYSRLKQIGQGLQHTQRHLGPHHQPQQQGTQMSPLLAEVMVVQ